MSQKIVQQIPIEKIITGKQVRERFDEESLKGLAQSLRESGQQEPIHVLRLAGDTYSLLTGGRRLRALRRNGSATVAAIIEEGDMAKGDVLVRQIIENAQREDLTHWEKAKAIDLLMKETGWNATQTAGKLGFANSTVTKLLSLLSLPEAIQSQVRAGELPATAAYDLSRVNDSTEQEQLAGRIANGELTRDGLSGAIKARTRSNGQAPSTAPTRVTAKLSGERSVTVCGASLTMESYVAVLEELLGRARQARTKGLALDTFCAVLRDESRRQQQSGREKAA